jgi:protein phosphatase
MLTMHAAVTATGGVRRTNEDAVLVSPPVFAVADGMGGHAAGEVASALALEPLAALARMPDPKPEMVLNAIEAANEAILARGDERPQQRGMGTTLTGLCLGAMGGTPHWYVFNVGDSRVYRFAGNRLSQVTVDHSEVAELVAAGRIDAEQARLYPRRNVLTRSLGSDPAPTADMWVLPADPDETFLLCSDGLTLEVDDAHIGDVLARNMSPADTADALVSMALAAGGRDNVSVVVVRLLPVDRSAALNGPTAPQPVSGGPA